MTIKRARDRGFVRDVNTAIEVSADWVATRDCDWYTRPVERVTQYDGNHAHDVPMEICERIRTYVEGLLNDAR